MAALRPDQDLRRRHRRHQHGQAFAATDNTDSLAGFTRVDGALYYKVNSHYDLQLNVENLFDKRYFLYADSNNNISPASGRAAKVSLNARF